MRGDTHARSPRRPRHLATQADGSAARRVQCSSTVVKCEQNRFFDGDGNRGDDPVIVLERVYENSAENWKMIHRIRCQDRHFAEPFEVPKDRDTFRTDLTSVPSVFAWLVPKTGRPSACRPAARGPGD